MSIDLQLPIGSFLRLSIAEYRLTLPPGTALSSKMLDEALTIAHEAWTAARKKKRAKPPSENEWMAKLKADPLLAGVDFEKQLAECQFWCRNRHPAVMCSRQRVTNWMRRAVNDAVVTSPGGAVSHAPLPDPGPVGWLEWARENLPVWRRITQEAEGYPIPPWHLLDASERHAIRTQMRGIQP